ncbi:MAG: hypothetical protein JO370_05350 [Paucibacter sp.]|nr:hypothetical protein [Roseateles sp.]
MKLHFSRWPAWAVALGVSVVGGLVYTIFYFVVPELGPHGLPHWLTDIRAMASLTVMFAAVIYAGLVDDKPTRRTARISWLHLIPAGAAAGIACAFLLHATTGTRADFEILSLSAVIGAALAVFGVFGFIARGL